MSHLTTRQTEVIQLLGLGRRDKEIADELGISVSTVRKKIIAARVKLDASTREQMMKHFYAPGWRLEK